MNTKQQGDIGVAYAIAFYTSRGYAVSVPITDSKRYDLIVDRDGRLDKIQCKTSRCKQPSGNYIVQLRTSGGNQSWNHAYKRLSVTDCDFLFVYSFDGKCYEFPIKKVAGRNSVTLYKQYDQFLVGSYTDKEAGQTVNLSP